MLNCRFFPDFFSFSRFPHLHYFCFNCFSLFNFQVTFSFENFFFLRPLVGTSGLEPPTSRLSGVRSNHLSYAPMMCRSSPSSLGGDEEDRTPDPLLAKQVLSQLSYTPIAGTLMLSPF